MSELMLHVWKAKVTKKILLKKAGHINSYSEFKIYVFIA